MTDNRLTDPRVDATTTVVWKRLKDPNLASVAEQVIMHNQDEMMKEFQRVVKVVEKLAGAVDRLANSQKLNKNRGGARDESVASARGAQAIDESAGAEDTSFNASTTSTAFKQLLDTHLGPLLTIFSEYIHTTKKKPAQMKSKSALVDGPIFVEHLIEGLGADGNITVVDDEVKSEILAFLEQIKDDFGVDLWVKLGKTRAANTSKKGKGKQQDSDSESVASTGSSKRKTTQRFRPGMPAIGEVIEEEEEAGQSGSRRASKTRKIVHDDEDEEFVVESAGGAGVEDDEEDFM